MSKPIRSMSLRVKKTDNEKSDPGDATQKIGRKLSPVK